MFKGIKELLKYDKRFLISFIAITFFILVSIISLFSPYDLRAWNQVPRDMPVGRQYLLGTNSLGQDILWRAMTAVKNSLVLGVIAALISRVIAIILGLFAGYKGGVFDRIIMTFNDSFIVIPLFPVLILIASILRSSMNLIVLGVIIGLFGWAWDARLFRSQILSLKQREFTKTALLSGMSSGKIIVKEHIPYVIPLIMAATINNIIWVIGMEVTLSVLGLTSLNIPTIGTMIYWSMEYQALFLGMFNWILTPVVICIVLIISLYLLSTSISKYLDPRTRLQMMKEE